MIGALLLAAGCARAPSSSAGDVAAALLDRRAIARLPDPPLREALHASWDRAALAEDPFANEDRGWFEGEDGGWKLLLDADGPGAIVRRWSANADRAGRMRIWIDGALAFDGPATDGFTWPGAPWGGRRGGAWSSEAPIPYAGHARVEIERSPGKGIYWQIDTVTWPGGTPLRSWTGPDEPAPPLVAPIDAPEILRREVRVDAGSSLEIPLPAGPFAIDVLRWEGPRTGDIEGWFDGEQTVDAPLGAFLSRPVGDLPGEAFAHAADGTGAESRWVMPWAREARIVIRGPASGTLVLRGAAFPWDDRTMRFHAAVRHEVRPTRPRSLFRVAGLEGPGVYVGETLWVDNPSDRWWGEGDEIARTDGEITHRGTGTEDWHGYAYCGEEPFVAPFFELSWADAGPSPDPCEHARGRAASTRDRILDRVPFDRSFVLDLEIWHKAETSLDLATLARWYAL